MPKMATRCLLYLGLVVGAYIAAAILVNPRNYFPTTIFPVLAQDSRATKQNLFVAYRAHGAVEALVLGSSRGMKLAPQQWAEATGQRTFNLCVGSARAEDYLALFRWAWARSPQIRTLLLSVDVEAFHDADVFDDRLEANPTLMEALGEDGHQGLGQALRARYHLWREIISRPYAVDMVRSVLAWRHRPPSIAVFDRDGLVRYPQVEAEKAADTFDWPHALGQSREDYIERFKGMSSLSGARLKRLETLLKEARSHGVRVTMWISPLHPDLASHLGRNTRYADLLRQARDRVARLGLDCEARFLDLSDPGTIGATPTEWVDGAHMDDGNARRLLARLIDGN
jgi:hypothetical protein